MASISFEQQKPHPNFEEEEEGGTAITAARFEVHPPASPCSARAVAQAFPEMTVEILRIMQMEDGLMLEDVQIRGDLTDPVRLEGILRALKGSLVKVLDREDRRLLVRVTTQTCWLMKIFRSVGTMPIYPLAVKDASLSILVVEQSQKIRDLYERFKGLDSNVLVATLKTDRVVGSRYGLTPRQEEIYKMARAAGYWDVPRRVSQTEIAYLFNLSKSTISETLAAVEKKIMRDGLNPSGS